MNWLIIASNIAFASISALICVLGWNTLKTIKYLNVGKSFWIPVILSGILFSISSIITILNDAVFALTVTVEIEQIMQLIALCSLSIGIYGYSKTIKRNIPEKYIIPEDAKNYIPSTISAVERKKSSNNLQSENASKCSHELGYLSTFPNNSSFPEECLSCNKIIECKRS